MKRSAVAKDLRVSLYPILIEIIQGHVTSTHISFLVFLFNLPCLHRFSRSHVVIASHYLLCNFPLCSVFLIIVSQTCAAFEQSIKK